jgi:hypothetical protein
MKAMPHVIIKDMREKPLDPDVDKEFREKLVVHGCKDCGGDFLKQPIMSYPDDGGWDIDGQKYWLYITCPDCGYQWSLWKLGVGRCETETEVMKDRCQLWEKFFIEKKADKNHHYPCKNWLEEKSCSKCRQIADELSYEAKYSDSE